MILTLPPGEYHRRLLRARAALIAAEEEANRRADEAHAGARLARDELARIDRLIARSNQSGPKGAA